MSTITAPTGPTPNPTNGPSPEQLETAFDHSIWYLLSLWHPLHVAVTNLWGGPSSPDKRDWFAGAISDLLTTSTPDAEELECVLLQIMQDEFDCNVEDESEVQVARDILAVKKRLVEERTLDAAREVEMRYRGRGQMKGSVALVEVNQEAEDDGTEWNGFEEEDGDEDEEMGGVPLLVPAAAPKEKPVPEVDNDGFTKVPIKKRGGR
ncbi:unnamed protein product [Zymoseptoria tritici ST99CH_1A5]|uniref:Pre-rRNA-processing protein TSR2 n=4 Tax=Zymoseptoria tritici TaxID=1047171 RepID=F9X451_ZYMTI|nr:uncharacterized protein MYCGRDRAFT_107883 [Zymoseptoria tritici IPO323]SMQ47261.1 unnamed protein product [Zymoseptoria tritici ST99CH_3D7]SMR45790.1 unnamed protein product [Zymoseptoria tritici ST99CH_1E4]SMR47043.1 unnamed protein product [Zymoseptoria tritici ST99CH_3D1]SMY20944.1 unnamed protein product [Zymoseptoria tritici ST99CH_1A5]EGP90717.1 hypothetical protein MYCGRDRAFT_107883 [Zymoseptoria tritici IPO323]